jgi:hypothetical protein
MIARPDDVKARNPDAGDCVGRARRAGRGPVRARLRTATSAVADLQLEGVRLLHLRRARVSGWLRRLAWTAAAAAMLVAAGAVALAAAVVI